jgi:hypothetical protein
VADAFLCRSRRRRRPSTRVTGYDGLELDTDCSEIQSEHESENNDCNSSSEDSDWAPSKEAYEHVEEQAKSLFKGGEDSEATEAEWATPEWQQYGIHLTENRVVFEMALLFVEENLTKRALERVVSVMHLAGACSVSVSAVIEASEMLVSLRSESSQKQTPTDPHFRRVWKSGQHNELLSPYPVSASPEQELHVDPTRRNGQWGNTRFSERSDCEQPVCSPPRA